MSDSSSTGLGGRSAIVTGSTSGIGLGIASALAQAGANVTLNGFGDPGEIERVRAGLAERTGVAVRHSGADMGKGEEVALMVRDAEAAHGALDFLEELRSRAQVIILSDTFSQFAHPLMRQLRWPTLFCHDLVVDPAGRVAGYKLRIADGKRRAVASLKALNFQVHAAGDSYNDTAMLGEAHRGVLFRCPDNVAAEFPQFRRTDEYADLMDALLS